MKYRVQFVVSIFFLFSWYINAQGSSEPDLKYKEDQFYFGFTYNIMGKQPSGFSQLGLSYGIHLGVIKDIPLNTSRNIGLGIGLGYSWNSYRHNLLIEEVTPDVFNYSILEDTNSFSKNKFTTHLVELPLEFRWRTSTAQSYKFWRIYTGLKMGYLFAHRTVFNSDNKKLKHTNVPGFNDFRYGAYLSAGYNTWNFYFYYSLNPIFNNTAKIDDASIDLNTLKVGLLFYIF